MWWIIALIAFAIAALMALLFHGATVMTVLGIIAIGLFFLALNSSDWTPRVGPRPRV